MKSIITIIPAFNEEDSIGKVIAEIPDFIDEIVVCNNNSSDKTAIVAQKKGATVVDAPLAGYGNACLAGLNYVSKKSTEPDIIVFLDGDYSDYPAEMSLLIQPIIDKKVDFVLGARKKELREAGSMTPQQVFGNALATFLMKVLFNSKFTDLGPFRAINYQILKDLKMEDKSYGWTVEMQLKILKQKIPYIEVPVHYKRRIGISKVSGTVKGTIFAGIKIIGWIFKYSIK